MKITVAITLLLSCSTAWSFLDRLGEDIDRYVEDIFKQTSASLSGMPRKLSFQRFTSEIVGDVTIKNHQPSTIKNVIPPSTAKESVSLPIPIMNGLTLSCAPYRLRNLGVLGIFHQNEALPHPDMMVVDILPGSPSSSDPQLVILAYPNWENETHRRLPPSFKVLSLAFKTDPLPKDAQILPHRFPPVFHYSGIFASPFNAHLIAVPVGSQNFSASFHVLGLVPSVILQNREDGSTSSPPVDPDAPENPNMHPRFKPKMATILKGSF